MERRAREKNPDVSWPQTGMAPAGDSLVILAPLPNAMAVPLHGYLTSLLYCLTLDVVSAIVSIPGKLDAMLRVSDRDEQRAP